MPAKAETTVKKLAVKKTYDGDLGITCPRCEEVVVPLYLEVLKYWNCPDCDQTLDPASLVLYRKAVKAQRDKEERDEYGEF